MKKTHPENVMRMYYYSGPLTDTLDATAPPSVLHVCVEHLDTGQSIAILRTSSAMAGVINRAAGCVDGSITLQGNTCTPETYIMAWRQAIVDSEGATLHAWLIQNAVTTTITLPCEDVIPKPWLSPLYHQAKARLFGAHASGRCVAPIERVTDICAAVHVIKGLAAFGMVTTSLTDTLSVHHHCNALRAAA